jgi:Uma2 family endonuclease
MTTPAAQALLTAEEFARMTDPPGVRSELVRGRVIRMPPAKTRHGRLAGFIHARLEAFAREHRLGEATAEGGYLLRRNPDTVRAPDAAFIAFERLPGGELPEDAYVEGAPDLAVEVVSPSETDAGVAEKVADWLAAGAERAWEVRPRTRTVTVHRRDRPPRTLGIDDTLTSDDAAFAVAGFALPLTEIFR